MCIYCRWREIVFALRIYRITPAHIWPVDGPQLAWERIAIRPPSDRYHPRATRPSTRAHTFLYGRTPTRPDGNKGASPLTPWLFSLCTAIRRIRQRNGQNITTVDKNARITIDHTTGRKIEFTNHIESKIKKYQFIKHENAQLTN